LSALVVPMERTPLNMVEVAGRLGAMFYELWGRLPSTPLLQIASGIIGFENAGGASIYNRNFGNVTAPGGYDGRVWTANGLFFLDFPSVEDGAKYWWRLMSARYHDVLVDADQGELVAAVRDLLRLGYLGRSPTAAQYKSYTAGVRSYAQSIGWAADAIATQWRRPIVGIAVGGFAAVAAAAGGYYWHQRRAVA